MNAETQKNDLSGQGLQRSSEPIFWALFGAGGMWSAIFCPALLLILCLLSPPGLLPEGVMDHERVLALCRSTPGKIFLFLTIALPLCCGLHRIRHSLHDLKQHSPVIAQCCYGLALYLSGAALVGILSL